MEDLVQKAHNLELLELKQELLKAQQTIKLLMKANMKKKSAAATTNLEAESIEPRKRDASSISGSRDLKQPKEDTVNSLENNNAEKDGAWDEWRSQYTTQDKMENNNAPFLATVE